MRLQVDLTPKVMAKLDEARELTDARSRVHVARRAIELYMWLLEQYRGGGEITVRSERNGEVRVIAFLGIGFQ